jgi:hypothetical protein
MPSLLLRQREQRDVFSREALDVCTENPIRVDDLMESPKLAE